MPLSLLSSPVASMVRWSGDIDDLGAEHVGDLDDLVAAVEARR